MREGRRDAIELDCARVLMILEVLPEYMGLSMRLE